MEKEIKINVPAGYEIDRENSTFECIKFKKKKPVKWRNSGKQVSGVYISHNSDIEIADDSGFFNSNPQHRNIFATEKQAKSVLAMAQISQIVANDERFGGPITDEEWNNVFVKYTITRLRDAVMPDRAITEYNFLSFHTEEQRDLFLKENEDLVNDYLMID